MNNLTHARRYDASENTAFVDDIKKLFKKNKVKGFVEHCQIVIRESRYTFSEFGFNFCYDKDQNLFIYKSSISRAEKTETQKFLQKVINLAVKHQQKFLGFQIHEYKISN